MIKKRIYRELGLPTFRRDMGLEIYTYKYRLKYEIGGVYIFLQKCMTAACLWCLTANLHSPRKKIPLKLIWISCKSGFENIYSVLALNIVLQLEAKTWWKTSGCQILSILSIMMHKCEHTYTLNTCVEMSTHLHMYAECVYA